MAKKILSFEEYAKNIEVDTKDEISEEENEECPCGTDEEGNCLECEESTDEIEDEDVADDESEDVDDDGEIEDEDVDDGSEDDDDDDDDVDDESDDDDDDDDESEDVDDESGDDDDASEEDTSTETVVTVEEMLSEGYSKVKEAACAYEKDAYQDHTLEMYMKENAALVATLAAKAMEEGYGEVKETEMTQEMYEAMCNELKEAYAKKIEELKEAYGAGKE